MSVDASTIFYKFVIELLQMEETKGSLVYKGVAERLTLGITRILGLYCRICIKSSRLCSAWLVRHCAIEENGNLK